MAEMSQWDDERNEDAYLLLHPDPLEILSSTRPVVEQGEHAWINRDRLSHLSHQWAQQAGESTTPGVSVWDERYHFNDGTERTVNWLVVLDAVNFCFWAEKDQPRWSIEYKGETLNGYWAEAAALTRAMEEGKPLWDAAYLSTMSAEDLAHIFRGARKIPLFEERLHNIWEVGSVLLARFGGQFSQAIEQAKGSAPQLAALIAREFPSFHDTARYCNREVCFFKRAQICVADLYTACAGQRWGALANLDQLTIFADYKLPQVLRHFGVLAYDPALATRVNAQELLEPGGGEEVEIRATTVWACELLRQALAAQDCAMTAMEIDQRLWLLGQNLTGMQPYHRAYTMYY
ncbi:MAG: queuosine salvage family protein [Chloroflexota bacterium]|nr:queuosine salvage family protein [Chloroflexota bacterium]